MIYRRVAKKCRVRGFKGRVRKLRDAQWKPNGRVLFVSASPLSRRFKLFQSNLADAIFQIRPRREYYLIIGI